MYEKPLYMHASLAFIGLITFIQAQQNTQDSAQAMGGLDVCRWGAGMGMGRDMLLVRGTSVKTSRRQGGVISTECNTGMH